MKRFGLIGCGFISRNHLHALAKCEHAQLTAVSDIQRVRMDEAVNFYHLEKGIHNQVKYFENYTEMLEDPQIDAVVIATISGFHFEMCKNALLAGKHVILEKPMALSIADSDQLIKLADEQNKKLMICHQLRFRPLMQRIKSVIDEGKLGKPLLGVASIRINRSLDYYRSAPWRGSWETDGGMLINQGIHLIDLLQWFMGDVKTVYGEISSYTDVKETEDVALGLIHFQNHAKGIVEANIVTQPNNLGYSLSIFGEKGTISVDGRSLNEISRWFIQGENTDMNDLSDLIKDTDEQIYMYQNFIEAIHYPNKQLLLDGNEGKKALEIIFGIYQSSLNGEKISFPIKSFATENMKSEEGK
ncbi:MAG: Gfo/Idh/MocA family protein [Heyndrickxia sp.]